MQIILLTVLSLMMSSSFAIEQEKPESNNDLRGGKPLLLVEQIDDEEKIELERTSAQFFQKLFFLEFFSLERFSQG